MASNRQKLRRQKSNILGGFFLVAGIALACWMIPQREPLLSRVKNTLPVKFVRLEGNIANVDLGVLQNNVRPLVKGSYLMLDLKEIGNAAARSPWVESASASRIWPDTVLIEIEEQTPMARWGKDALISNMGQVFSASTQMSRYSGLPELRGPKGRGGDALRILQGLNEKFAARGVSIKSLTLSERLSCTVELSDGLVILFGNEDPLAAADRFLAILPDLGEPTVARLKTVNLNYPRGFAVTWKSEKTEEDNASKALSGAKKQPSTKSGLHSGRDKQARMNITQAING